MATGTVVPVSEYRRTLYRPDCDYVDGVVDARNLGELDHGYHFKEAVGRFRVLAPLLEVRPLRSHVTPQIDLVDTENIRNVDHNKAYAEAAARIST